MDILLPLFRQKFHPLCLCLVFLALTAWIVYRGVEKGIEKYSKIISAGADFADRGNCDLWSDLVPSGCRRDGQNRNAGIISIYLKPDFYRADGEKVSGDFAGCDESVIFLSERIDGNYGDLWFLCKR